MVLEHGEITEQIIGAAFEVYSILGYGFLGRVYQRSMQVELRARGLKAEIEDKIKVWYKKELVGDDQADHWVAESVIVELKVAREYHTEDEAQLLQPAQGDGNLRRTPDRFRANHGRVQKAWLLNKSRSTPPGGMISGESLSVSVFNPCLIRG